MYVCFFLVMNESLLGIKFSTSSKRNYNFSKNFTNEKIFFKLILLRLCLAACEKILTTIVSPDKSLFFSHSQTFRIVCSRGEPAATNLWVLTLSLAIPTRPQYSVSYGLHASQHHVCLFKWKYRGNWKSKCMCQVYQLLFIRKTKAFLAPHIEEVCLYHIDQKYFTWPCLASRDPRMIEYFKWLGGFFIYNLQ